MSRRYTNHCLRSTAITILDDNTFASRHIMAVSGHRAESPLKTYARHTSEETPRNVSHILVNSTIGENIDIPLAITEEVSVNIVPSATNTSGQESTNDMSVSTIETNSNNTSTTSDMDFEILEIPDNMLANVPMPNFHNAPQYVNCSATVNYNYIPEIMVLVRTPSPPPPPPHAKACASRNCDTNARIKFIIDTAIDDLEWKNPIDFGANRKNQKWPPVAIL